MNNIQGGVDCHTHILPGLDDGPATVDESIEMVKTLCSQGVNTIWLTPHFYPFKESMEVFLDRREKSTAHFLQNFHIPNVNLILGSETYFSDYIFNISDIAPLCIGNSRYILTELPSEHHSVDKIFSKIEKLISTYNVVPIIAHIERYPELFGSSAYLRDLIALGCFIQTNTSSLSGGLLQKRRVTKYIKGNLIHLIGTDCHGMNHRVPDFSAGVSVLSKALGPDSVQMLNQNAREVMKDITIQEIKRQLPVPVPTL